MKRSLLTTTPGGSTSRSLLLLILLMLSATALLRAQPRQMQAILLVNDSTMIATIADEDDTRYTIVTSSGKTHTLPKSSVKSMQPTGGSVTKPASDDTVPTARRTYLKQITYHERMRPEWGVELAQDSVSILLLNDEGDVRRIALSEIERIDDLPTDTRLMIQTRDGSEIMGSVVGAGSSSVHFRTAGGVDMEIPPGHISRIEQTRRTISNGKYQRFDPNRTRLFFAPTGRSLNAGEGYFSVAEIFLPFAAVGITDWLTIGGGISLIPGAPSQLVYGTIKATPVRGEQGGMSVGILYMGLPSEGIDGAGIAYAVGTIGSNDNAFTFGIGESISGQGSGGAPILMIGGEIRASNSLKFITENWIPTGGELGVLSFGIRLFGDNISGDFGLITTTRGLGGSGFPFVPWLGFGYNFGK